MTPEHLLMNQIRSWCGEHNLLCFRCNVGKVLTAEGRWFETGLPEGFSDLLVCDNNGHTIFVETKVKPYKPTKQQLNFQHVMRQRGFGAFVVYSLDEFINYLQKYFEKLNYRDTHMLV